MNCRAECDATIFILGGEIPNRTNKQTNSKRYIITLPNRYLHMWIISWLSEVNTVRRCVCVCVCVLYTYTATSGGDQSSLRNTHHGACVKHNMKLSVQVCCRPDSVGELNSTTALVNNASRSFNQSINRST